MPEKEVKKYSGRTIAITQSKEMWMFDTLIFYVYFFEGILHIREIDD